MSRGPAGDRGGRRATTKGGLLNAAALIAAASHSLNNALSLMYATAARLESAPEPDREAAGALDAAIRRSRGVAAAFALLTVVDEPEAATGTSAPAIALRTLRDWLGREAFAAPSVGARALALDEELLKPLIGCAMDAVGARRRGQGDLEARLGPGEGQRLRIEIATPGQPLRDDGALAPASPGEIALGLARERLERIGIGIDPRPPLRAGGRIAIDLPLAAES